MNTPSATETNTQLSQTENKLGVQPPHNIEIEQSLLSSLMNVDESFDQVSEFIKASDFYGERHKIIFDTIHHLAYVNQPYDIVMVYDTLKQQNLLDLIGGEEYLTQINQSTSSAFNLVSYARRIRELSVYRQLIAVGNNLLTLAHQPKKQSLEELLDKIESDIFSINESYANNDKRQGVQNVVEILESVTSYLQEMKSRPDMMTGLRTPFDELNNKTQGLQKGDLVIVAARPSMGKTTFALNLISEALVAGLPVVMFSMEMPAEAIMMRILSAWSDIHQSSIRSGKLTEAEWQSCFAAMEFFQHTHFHIDARNNLSPTELRSTCRRVAKNYDGTLGMIVVDYLQLMKVPGIQNNRVQEIAEISRSLKALAREMNCPVVALSQLNRGLESRTDKRPVMADLRESGAIEQDADLIMFIYRDEVYKKDKPDNKGLAEIIIGKQRNGPIGKIPLRFIGEYTRFDNWQESVPNDFEAE